MTRCLADSHLLLICCLSSERSFFFSGFFMYAIILSHSYRFVQLPRRRERTTADWKRFPKHKLKRSRECGILHKSHLYGYVRFEVFTAVTMKNGVF
jgi:hypothetical protein